MFRFYSRKQIMQSLSRIPPGQDRNACHNAMKTRDLGAILGYIIQLGVMFAGLGGDLGAILLLWVFFGRFLQGLLLGP